MTSLPRAMLLLAFPAVLPLTAHSTDSDSSTDYAPILSRALGISDEPSLRNECGPNYSGVRIIELAGGQPKAIARIEKHEDGVTLTVRFLESGQPPSTTESKVSLDQWIKLADLFRKSGLWTYHNDETEWIADGPMLWVEGCINSEFRSLAVYPDLDNRMRDVIDFLRALRQ